MPLADFDQGVAGAFKTSEALSTRERRFSNAAAANFVPAQVPQSPAPPYTIPTWTRKPPNHPAPPPRTPPPTAAPDLTEKQRRYLRGLAHPLKPVILLGKEGLTDSVAKETARALHDHELIKVKGLGGDRDARDAAFTALAERTGSALVHRIGNVGVLYRPRPDLKRILIPD